jgi:SAM-dependent methyltransferase
LPDPVKALRAFLRVLKSGGKASVVAAGAPEKSPLYTVPIKALAKHIPDFKTPPPGTPGLFAIPSVQALRELFLKAEFSNFTGQVVEGSVGVESAEEYWQMGTEITGVLALVFAKLPDEKKQAIRDEVIATVKNMFPSGPLELKIETVLGTGTKP